MHCVGHAPVQPPPSSVTRAVSTPPLAAPVAPLTANKPFLAQCATALLGAAGACAPVIQQINSGAQSISDAIKPYTDNSHVAQMESFILLALAVTAAVGVVLGIARHKAQASR